MNAFASKWLGINTTIMAGNLYRKIRKKRKEIAQLCFCVLGVLCGRNLAFDQ
jgi:hypothetical protein